MCSHDPATSHSIASFVQNPSNSCLNVMLVDTVRSQTGSGATVKGDDEKMASVVCEAAVARAVP